MKIHNSGGEGSWVLSIQWEGVVLLGSADLSPKSLC